MVTSAASLRSGELNDVVGGTPRACFLIQDVHKPRSSDQTSPSLKLSNGYILPEGKRTPNALFVGGIDLKVDENEMRDFFARYGAVKEVKIITYRGGICKGYGFVYFSEDVNIQSIIEQQISFKGRKLKLGPAIMKERSYRSMPSRPVCLAPWMNPTQYFYCTCCSPMGGGTAQPTSIFSGSGSYNQPCSYSNFGGLIIPQVPMNYAQNSYAYQYTPVHWTADQRTQAVNQNFVDCGVQTMLTVL
ncbi:deleted in azoospermia-like [Chelmon rostratus]|uniref:deleted in azoospermia-like n=1 Tax=Chelmon rostratus TaxID=109905 RepID=UPI001BE9F832|nr:deleted in azoospermia-like [Chelmon rostratus]